MVQMIEPNTEATKTRFFFIRHGQTEHNVRKIFQGHLDIALNDEGHSQAFKLGESLKEFPFDMIYSSDLIRCRETVAKVVDGLQDKDIGDVEFTDKLRERHMGEIQGMHIDDAIAHGKKHGVHYREFGEDSKVFGERLRDCLDDLEKDATQHKYKNVAVVSHGGTIRAVLQLIGVADAGVVYNTSITVIDFAPDTKTWNVQVVGDTSHLGEQMNVQDQRVR